MLGAVNILHVIFSMQIILAETDTTNKCSLRNSTEVEGICIFAIDCLRLKGQHVDVCMDQLYVKSCCALPGSLSTQQSTLNQPLALTRNDSIIMLPDLQNDTVIAPFDQQNNVIVSVTNWILAATESFGNLQENKNLNYSIEIVEQKLKAGLNLPLNVDSKLVCGRTYHKSFPSLKIVGGEDSKFAQWPWQVSLRHRKQALFSHSCGAVLLSNAWILTAAHCVHFKSDRDILVRLGEYDQSNENEILPHVDYSVSTIVSHPYYNERTFNNDIALLRLSKPTTFRANVLPICLPVDTQDNITYNNVTAVVTGWGQLFPYGPYATKLQQVQIPIISNSKCKEMLQKKTKFSWIITDNTLCAALMAGGKDACEGDSGGPIVVRRSDNRWELVGIISWGLECAKPGMPGVYTRVSKFIDWIQAVMTT